MKTIILYATKYGTAAAIAKRIADKTGGAVIHNLKENIPPLADFDCIILGSPVYAGMIRREAKSFLAHNAQILHEKKLGLFLCGLSAGDAEAFFDANFSPALLQKASAKNFLGGIFDPKKAGWLERLIMKIITKQSGYIEKIYDKKIEQFAQAILSL